jgi:hypothetical protein
MFKYFLFISFRHKTQCTLLYFIILILFKNKAIVTYAKLSGKLLKAKRSHIILLLCLYDILPSMIKYLSFNI